MGRAWLLVCIAVSTHSLAATPAESSRPRVYVGAYLNDVSAFDLKAGEFKADLTVWCKWRGEDAVPPIEFRNGAIDQRDELGRQSDGDWRMVRWRIQGTFRGTFPVHRFPFDRQNLKLEMTLADRSRVLVPDLAASGMNPDFSITGWLYEPYFRAETTEATMPSDLGSIDHEGEPEVIQSVALVLTLNRPFASYVLKFVLPLLIIIAMALLSFFLRASELEVRAGMVVTSLLSCVAFHFSQADSLPDVSYLVAADKLFLAAYLVILLALIATVVSFRIHERSADQSRTVDRVARASLGLGIGAAMVLILGSANRDDAADDVSPRVQLPRTPSSEGPVLRVGIIGLTGPASLGLAGLQRRGLTSFDAEGNRIPLALVEFPDMTNASARLLPDGGLRVRWRLRPGIHFNDGSPMTAQDLIASMELSREPDRTSLVAVDALTVDATWKTRTPAAFVERAVYPASALAARAAALDAGMPAEKTSTEHLPGDGPFKIETLQAGKFARVVPNPWFAGEPPKLSAIEFTPYETSVELADALLAGKIDLAPHIAISGLEKLRGDAGFAARVEAAPTLWHLQPDLGVPALAKVNVRRALLMAIDRRRFAQLLFGDPALVTDTYVAPHERDHLAVEPTAYDPARARAILEAEGAVGLKVPVYYFDTPAGSPQSVANQIVIDGLRAAGLLVEPKPVTKGITDLLNGAAHGGLVLHTRATDGTPARVFNLPIVAGRFDRSRRGLHFTDETARALAAWEYSLFPERKESLSARLQRTFVETLPVIPLCAARDQSAHSTRLVGFRPVQRSVWWNVETWTLQAAKQADGQAASSGVVPAQP